MITLMKKKERKKNKDETNKDQRLTQKQVCGTWLNVGIPYMVSSGRSDQLAQWERDWYSNIYPLINVEVKRLGVILIITIKTQK